VQALSSTGEGRCAITGLAVPEILRASHIKPWADCEIDPHLDVAFDRGLITITNDAVVLVSSALGIRDRQILG
jgi:putative restriction endonuclease